MAALLQKVRCFFGRHVWRQRQWYLHGVNTFGNPYTLPTYQIRELWCDVCPYQVWGR